MPILDPRAAIANRVHALRDYHQGHGFERAELDISGGIDSAVMLQLLCHALGPERVTAVYTGIHSSADSLARARAAAQAAGIPLAEVELSEIFDALQAEVVRALSAAGFDRAAIEQRIESDPTVLGSVRSCIRSPVGRGANRMTGGGIRHGTGNECEDRFLRFFQKGGDGEVDSNPIAMLSKGEVFQIARALEVPRSILEAVPSPDLHGTGEAHNDEDELRDLYGIDWTYSKVDPDSGHYTYVGTIERMSRLLDEPGVERKIFGAAALQGADLEQIVATGQARAFRGFDADTVRAQVESARHIERVTRHKMNPNCPTLGDRETLVAAEILTDELPEVGSPA